MLQGTALQAKLEFTTLHGLLRAVVQDARAVAADPTYLPNWGNWHQPKPARGVCEVCLAGAYVAKTLQQPPDRELDVGLFDLMTLDTPKGRLWFFMNAIDRLRIGDVESALGDLWRLVYSQPLKGPYYDLVVGVGGCYEADLEATSEFLSAARLETHLDVIDELIDDLARLGL